MRRCGDFCFVGKHFWFLTVLDFGTVKRLSGTSGGQHTKVLAAPDLVDIIGVHEVVRARKGTARTLAANFELLQRSS